MRALYREGTLLKGSTFLVVPDVTGQWQRPTLYLSACFSVPDFGTTTSAFTVKATLGLPEMGVEPTFSCVITYWDYLLVGFEPTIATNPAAVLPITP